jgi:hypothetical protein
MRVRSARDPRAGDTRIVLQLVLQSVAANEVVATVKLVSKSLLRMARDEMQRRDLPDAVVRLRRTDDGSGGVPLHAVKQQYATLTPYHRQELVILAAAHAQVDVLQWLASQGCALNAPVCVSAARGGHIDALQWLLQQPQLECNRSQREQCVTSVFVAAGTAGHIHVLKWLRAQGAVHSDTIAYSWELVARGGHIPVLEWMQTCDSMCVKYVFLGAACGGHVAVMQWVQAQGHVLQTEWQAQMVAAAASGGHVAMVEWLMVQQGCAYDEGALFEEAAEGGHIAMMEWLNAHNCSASVRAYIGAAGEGNVAVLDWLYEHGCSFDDEHVQSDGYVEHARIQHAFHAAAYHGHLQALKWLHAREFPWDALACSNAVRGGHLFVLQWLRKRGCPLDGRSFAHALLPEVRRQGLGIWKWLCKHESAYNPYECSDADTVLAQHF